MTKKQMTKNEQKSPDIEQNVPILKKGTSHKGLIKPLLFFGIFLLCIEAAVLYPLFTEETTPVITLAPQTPALILEDDIPQTETNNVAQSNDEQPIPEEVQPCPICEYPTKNNDNTDSQLVQQLQARIHELELENLSLKEQNTVSNETTPLLLDLISQIYLGRPFQKQLNVILKHDKTNDFALTIQKNLGQYATKGIPDSKKIEQLFTSKFQIALDSFYLSDQNKHPISYIKSLVHIYPQDLSEANANGIEWLYLAKKHVQNNDFQQAIDSLNHLPKQSKKLFQEFIDATNARNSAIQILDFEIIGKEIK